MKLTPQTCKEITELVSQGMDRTLSLKERFLIRFHVVYCRGCQLYRQQLNILREYLKKPPEPQSLSNQAKEAIQEKINQVLGSGASPNT